MRPSGGSQPTLQLQDLWPQCLTHASPTYRKFYHPSTTYLLASLAFSTGRCVFLNAHPQSALLQLKVTIVCLSLWQWWPRWSLLRLSSALLWQAQAPQQMGQPGKACGAQGASGEVRSVRCVEVGAQSIWLSIFTDWRQPEKEAIPQIIQDKLGLYTALSDVNSEVCN